MKEGKDASLVVSVREAIQHQQLMYQGVRSIGFVYVMANAAMPGLYKIGYTMRSPTQRAFELSSGTGVPAPFVVAFFAEADQPEQVEKSCHARFAEFRINDSREFFMLEPEQVRDVIAYFQEEAGEGLVTEVGRQIVNPERFGPYLQLFPVRIDMPRGVAEA